MKKLTLLFIGLVLGIMLVALVGCGAENAQSAQSAPVGLANPLRELSKEEFDKSGFEITAPEGAEDVKYFTIATDPVTYQMTFTLEGSEFTVRVQPTGIVNDAEMPDISGMYYEWDQKEDHDLGYNTAHLYWQEGGPGHITWLDKVPGLQYDVSMNTGASKVVLLSVASMCCPPVQGDAG